MKCEMRCKLETVTPEYARAILEKNDINRHMRESYVRQLAAEMVAGRWIEHHQAIAINCDGTLIDGQHRLAATILSRKPQRFFVVRGVPKEAIDVIDAHSHRNTRDALRIVHKIETTSRAVACALAIEARGTMSRLAPAARISVYLEHKKLVERAERIFNTNMPGVCRSNVMAVVARALAVHNVDEVEPFCEILVSGESRKPNDRIVVKLRDFLITKVAGQGGRGTSSSTAYRRTETALHAWLNGSGADAVLSDAEDELFVIPGETKKLLALLRAAPKAKKT
jgi:hypothetical protein